jgi:hypothetical protein
MQQIDIADRNIVYHFSMKCRTVNTIMLFKLLKNIVICNTAVTNVSCQSGIGMLSSLLACLVISVFSHFSSSGSSWTFPLLQRMSLSICCLSQAYVDGCVHMSCTLHFPSIIIFRLCSVVCHQLKLDGQTQYLNVKLSVMWCEQVKKLSCLIKLWHCKVCCISVHQIFQWEAAPNCGDQLQRSKLWYLT